MIVVRVELWSALTGQKSEIARMVIDKTGGTLQSGDYRCRTLRGRSEADLDMAMPYIDRPPLVTREGEVLGHARLREHVWNLVAKALSSMSYGQKGGAE